FTASHHDTLEHFGRETLQIPASKAPGMVRPAKSLYFGGLTSAEPLCHPLWPILREARRFWPAGDGAKASHARGFGERDRCGTQLSGADRSAAARLRREAGGSRAASP